MNLEFQKVKHLQTQNTRTENKQYICACSVQGTLRLGGYNVTGEKQENKMSAMQREALKTKIGIPPLPPRAGGQLG